MDYPDEMFEEFASIVRKAKSIKEIYIKRMHEARSDYQMLYYSIDDVVDILEYIVGE